jgi:anthranilate synthase component 1
MKIERYSHVMHIVSEVSGTLREGFSGLDAFRSIFPAGTLTGAPKLKAMSLIAGFEPHCRRVYGGGVLVCFAFDGSVDSAIAISNFGI